MRRRIGVACSALAWAVAGCSSEPPLEAVPSAETPAACEDAACAPPSTPPSTPAPPPSPPEAPPPRCGLGEAALCAVGATCTRDEDCETDYCDAVCAKAPAAAATDGRRNAGETDVDCGGREAPDCEAGKRCASSDDCTSTCTGGVCDAPSDGDGKTNNGETDVDCGGPNGKTCVVGRVCVEAADCGLGWCKAGTCALPSVSDGLQNGTETDVDCGGAAQTHDGVTVPAAPRCLLAGRCVADADCEGALCAASGRCVEAPSCRPVHGGYTCGAGEVGQPGAAHESCCKSLPVPGLTMMQGGVAKQVYLDKYEITAGRVRAWITAIKSAYGGVPNVRAWVEARAAEDPILAAMFPGDWMSYLPAAANNQPRTFPVHKDLRDKDFGGQATVDLDMGLDSQLGPTSYYRGVQVNGTSGCYMGQGAYGHRTYAFDQVLSANFGELFRDAQDVLDAKSMNCMTPILFAAFCAWDGGYMQSQAAIAAAYGPKAWPWGDTPTPKDEAVKIANYNVNTINFGAALAPRYLFPIVNYATFADDFTSIIAAPGRFPGDIASLTRPGQESWMDLGGNMLEWSQVGGAFRGWTGASFEGHFYGRTWTSNVYFLDKYGKGSSRCMRLR